MSTMVVKTIVSRANAAGLYSISADETTDKQKKVDLPLGIRYVHEMQAEESDQRGRPPAARWGLHRQGCPQPAGDARPPNRQTGQPDPRRR